MPSLLTALLCIGLPLSQRISTQMQTVPKPTIWAEPDFKIPWGKPVALWCRGAHEAVEYQLHFEGQLSASVRPSPPEVRVRVRFDIPAMTLGTAGKYSCAYQSGGLWSEPSDPLDLVMTGMHDTPTLSVHPGPAVASGENVTFSCHLETGTSRFFLLREGKASRLQQKYGKIPAEFPLGPVTAAHRGTYRCFGSYNSHLWSFPSEPVELLVTDVGNTSVAPPEDTSPPELALWSHNTRNLIRIGLGCLVLLALVSLLVEDWLSRRRTQRGAQRASRKE
ncbi:natural cytotoxicity triggering receptor 1-like isoform X2 [Talpa occidentalis]|uniref:natural cytotoxicity triggering receptor 1-like isoform X2 n=1 Tax=Talpa occidentalis TaxID=50954 RepID=UPI001890B303|nr:natural cytotoxicity triggering receptor 1-like isoform X2 [Talpa occidentalis]